jgi:hypothetical protein
VDKGNGSLDKKHWQATLRVALVFDEGLGEVFDILNP